MKLLTHNMLACNKPGCAKPGVVNFPLKIVISDGMSDETLVRDDEAEFNPEFLQRILDSRIEYDALVVAAQTIGISLPETKPTESEIGEEFLRSLHEALLVVDVKSGVLVCPNCSREFSIKDGVPNMVLHEDEL